MPGFWHTDTPKDAGVRAGYVELYFRASQRLFVLKFPGDTDRIFRLKLPANPVRAKYRAWSDWQNPDFVAKGGERPSHPSGGNEYQIRYKMGLPGPINLIATLVERVSSTRWQENCRLILAPSTFPLPSVRVGLALSGQADPPLPCCARARGLPVARHA